MMPESIVIEIGERVYYVTMGDDYLMYAPCEFMSFDSVIFNVEDMQVIDVRPAVASFFSPLADYTNDIKALLLGQLTR